MTKLGTENTMFWDYLVNRLYLQKNKLKETPM